MVFGVMSPILTETGTLIYSTIDESEFVATFGLSVIYLIIFGILFATAISGLVVVVQMLREYSDCV